MMKLKRIGAIILAVMMVAVCAAAWAAGNDGRTVNNSVPNTYSGTNNTNAITGTNNRVGATTIPLTKSIVFSNLNGSDVYEPNITFSYAVAPASITDSTYTVTDADSNSGYVHPGVTGGVSGVDIVFGTQRGTATTDATTPVATSAGGVDIERTENLTVDLSKFSKPGIYRYMITETSNPSDVTAAGLTARTANYKTDRYLDVYIRYVDEDNDTATPDVLEMYGAVIFKSTTTTAGQDNITTQTTKTTGYAPSATSGDLKNDETVDRYTTYDITVKKVTSGSMADSQHDFPFYVSITNSIAEARYTYYDDPGTTGAADDVATGGTITKGSDSNSSALKLKNNEFVKFVGVPSNQTTNTELTIVVKEFNDTVDQYTPSVAVSSEAEITLTSTNAATGNAMTASTGSDTTSSFAIKSNDAASQILKITNTLTEISPTGIVLRFAPYMLILVGGIALLIIAKKHKKHPDEE